MDPPLNSCTRMVSDHACLVSTRSFSRDVPAGFFVRRKNLFLKAMDQARWVLAGSQVRLFRRGALRKFENRPVHEDVCVHGRVKLIPYGALIHHSYPTLSDYIEHMNRYSLLGAEMVVGKGNAGFSFVNIVMRPLFTFLYNYFFRLGFLDGREGLLLHLYHAAYVSWKYAKAWELRRSRCG